MGFKNLLTDPKNGQQAAREAAITDDASMLQNDGVHIVPIEQFGSDMPLSTIVANDPNALKNDHRTGPVIEISAGNNHFSTVSTAPMVHQFGHSMDDLFEPGLDLDALLGNYTSPGNSLTKKIDEQVEAALQAHDRSVVRHSGSAK